ncbi:ATP-binding protein [Streptomyces sp. NBC_01335]|uniref:ATP-binding protein n=1 Tax=Streptomyces sp. NBC_01335 TaxID=2903828 RepID=UPI002E13C437|nr:ATP-binding protein [Streptomyces sp. NBC_01335]
MTTTITPPTVTPPTITPGPVTPDPVTQGLLGTQTVPLPSGPEAPSHARRATVAFLHRTRPALAPERHDDVLLIVSELVTNAVRHASGPSALILTTTAGTLDIAVTDCSCVVPAARVPDLTDGTGGMGLHIAEDLGARVFTEPLPDGKCVHAAFDDA